MSTQKGLLSSATAAISRFPLPIILLLILVALGQFILVKTKFGRYSCAIGGNKEAARLSGIKSRLLHDPDLRCRRCNGCNVRNAHASRLLSVTPLAGQGYELDATVSAVIGGTSVSGGEGSSRENSHRGVVADDDNQCVQPDWDRSLCSIRIQRTCNSGSGWIRFILQGPWLEESANRVDPKMNVQAFRRSPLHCMVYLSLLEEAIGIGHILNEKDSLTRFINFLASLILFTIVCVNSFRRRS